MKKHRDIFAVLLLAISLASRGYAVEVVANIQRGPMITIAASNTPAAKRQTADFVCNGTNDEATILLALAKLRGPGDVDLPGDNQIATAIYKSQGGTIFFLSGEYYLDSTLTISPLTATHHVRLDGEAGATLFINNINETAGIVFDGSQASTGNTHGYNRPEIFNLTFVGNFDELNPGTAHCGDLVQMNDVAYPHVQNCHFLKAGRDGFHMTTPNVGLIAPQNRIIDANQFLGCARHGIYISDSHDLMISNCQVEENARLAGSGGAGMYIVRAIGGTFTNVMSEDNESTFNPNAPDIETVQSGLNLIGCDGDNRFVLDVKTGLNLKLTNCHVTNEILITGSNSNITLENCDAATKISCLLNPADQGTFTMIGGRTAELTVDAGKVLLTNAKINGVFSGNMLELSVIGGYLTLGDFGLGAGFFQVRNASFIGLTKLLVKPDGTGVFEAEDTLSIIGCGFEPTANYSFLAGSNCRILVQTGWDHLGGVVTLGQLNASQSGIRMTLDCNLRSPAIVISEIDLLKLTGTVTGGTINVNDCNSAMTLMGMAMSSSPVISFLNCPGRGVMMGCAGTGTVNRATCPLYVDAYFVVPTNNPAITLPALIP